MKNKKRRILALVGSLESDQGKKAEKHKETS
jgi:hypothetical protein